jgi:starch phosphorylase
VGWALGDGQEHGDDPAVDDADAVALYEVLERQVIPEFYTRDAHGIPSAWVARMRESMARLTPIFSSLRAVRDYTEQYYLPASQRWRQRVADQASKARQLVDWRQQLERCWRTLRFGELTIETSAQGHAFQIDVSLAELAPDAVAVELYADALGEAAAERHAMVRAAPAGGPAGTYRYSAAVAAGRPASDYTPRLVPYFDGAAIPLEAARILWQR